jgi:hypothetical protein
MPRHFRIPKAHKMNVSTRASRTSEWWNYSHRAAASNSMAGHAVYAQPVELVVALGEHLENLGDDKGIDSACLQGRVCVSRFVILKTRRRLTTKTMPRKSAAPVLQALSRSSSFCSFGDSLSCSRVGLCSSMALRGRY